MEYLSAFATSKLIMTDSPTPPTTAAFHKAEEDQPLLGRIAVHYDMITKDQLAWALREQSHEGGMRKLGDILVAAGLITSKQLQQLILAQQELVAQQKSAREAATDQPSSASTGAGIDELLQMAVEQRASDLHIHSGSPLRLRIQGDFLTVPGGDLPPEEIRILVESILEPEQLERLHETGQVDFCYEIEGLARFRVNAYRQQNGLDAVFRVINLVPPTLSELDLPLDIARFANHHQGMVLITGPGGCGKSSTLAALIRLINEERRHHIITIEDPIEYHHPSQRCIVNQRQVERHTNSFAAALRASLREDPDVIVIGELRDLETISLALTAAETGHLVLATLHTTNAIATVNRLVGAFPPAQQSQVRTMVSESLRGVISQRLVKRLDGQGRVPAVEILVVTTAVGNLIRQRKTHQLQSIIQTSAADGMCLLDESLRQLVARKVVAREEALRLCENPKSLAESAL
ncbi:MAG: type IV pilus twitching motility protein PilT [Thermoanaerobaculia bacterium]